MEVVKAYKSPDCSGYALSVKMIEVVDLEGCESFKKMCEVNGVIAIKGWNTKVYNREAKFYYIKAGN